MSSARPPAPRIWLALAIALTVLKLWLTRGQGVYAIATASLDDGLFMKLADHLVRGQWLGPYNELTLAKGPFYSLWIAFCFVLGVPLRLGEQLLYTVACVLVVRAVRPIVSSPALCFGLYTLLLWNPMSFEASVLSRVLRQNVYAPLTLLLFAAALALCVRAGRPGARLLPWALLLGFTFAAFHLTREESIWVGPSLALLAATAAGASWRARRWSGFPPLAAAGVAAATAAGLPLLTVSWLNWHHYGWFGTVEFRADSFRDSYGALTRIEAGPDLPFVPVTRADRLAAYEVSPSFAKLQPLLEGDHGRIWARFSSFLTHQPEEALEVAGGWFMWSFRDAVFKTVPEANAARVLALHRQIADEINGACEDGRLPAGPARSGFAPRWRPGLASELARTSIEFADYFVTFRNFSAYTPNSIGWEQIMVVFRDLSGDKVTLSPDAAYLHRPRREALDNWKASVLHRVGRSLRWPLFALALAAHMVAAVRLVLLLRRRRLNVLLLGAIAAWGASAACVLIHALIHITSFPTLTISSFAPAYPLLLLFIGLVGIDFIQWWRPASSTDQTQAPDGTFIIPGFPDHPPAQRTGHADESGAISSR